MKNLLKNFGIIIIVLLVVASILGYSNFTEEKTEKVGINVLIEDINQENITSIEVRGDTLLVTTKEEGAKQKEVRKELGQSFSELTQNYGVDSEKLKSIDVSVQDETGFKFWAGALLPYLLPILLIIGLIYFMSRQVQGANSKAMGFGQSRAREAKKDEKSKITFKDVAGAKEAKEELQEIVEFLKNPKKFAVMGAKIPKGVLLMGSPGTGKTLMAKAVAGEADVPFFHISGSEFVEMFVGVGASRVRDLFNKAKKVAPAIVFIDEMDAVGRKRGAGLGGSHDEREQTLNQILVEMDGFEPNLGVIVIGATNRPDVLDRALLRPGRFDRRVTVDMPDISDRLAILKVHVGNKPMSKEVNLQKLAERTPGFAGADLANLLNEAAIRAVRLNKKEIDQEDILDSIEKVLLGPEKRSRVMTKHERKMTAYHEAGHAVVGHFLENCDPVRKISIIGRGQAGGYTLSTPERDKRYRTIAQFKDDLAMILGGYVTERMIYGDDQLSTGPSSDLKKATQMATSMVMRYGMSDKLGPRMYGEQEEMIFLAQEIHAKKNYSESTAQIIDEEINRILEEAKIQSKKTIEENRHQMDELVRILLEKETVEQEEFNSIMGTKKEDK
ncbi:MAG: ATP-dependent zinc metalloprotease FtsH [Candidatus Magasanikbacteria bacterium]|jgi:cell division protease FtsH|nr:ATP-dependent zinc metalloprotease FtsH [Candidatus Magasanikbacteria bacterium]MBT4220692.1 ATP-dependent zinc metalloprotease FtsH [Candidatus Magasanikbacteria bacterium]MBT4350359.1 ATP-dependent zinc metalloprotease FtsH [Candidatus Magasanikbacteria bacterium]MBT4541763.1 ATP-dependent zinc metalloprotease FtsH [Candidatus Magasanikbacteria bacterium]MBT6252781.1 ATP-dependent zinc metalloprotease FtsH [Candidatus Magasanikbacteria bacterium]